MLSRISQFSWEVKNWLLFKKKKKTAQKTEVMRAISKMRSRAIQVLAFPHQIMRFPIITNEKY